MARWPQHNWMLKKTPMPSLEKCYYMLNPSLKETDPSSSNGDMHLLQQKPVQLGSNQVNMVVET